MIGMKITVQSGKLNRALRAIEGRIRKPRVAMAAAGRIGVAEVRRNFERGCYPSGRVWQPLTPFTLALRRDPTGKPLMDTGGLFKSVKSQVQSATSVLVYTEHPGAKTQQYGRIMHVRNKRFMARLTTKTGIKGMMAFRKGEALVGRAVPKIRIIENKKTGEQFIYLGKKARIPPRQFMFLTANARDRIADTVADYIMKGAVRA